MGQSGSSQSRIYQGDIPMLKIIYGEREVLTLLPEQYLTLEHDVRRLFNFSGNERLILSTEMSATGGRRVKIDPIIWPIVKSQVAVVWVESLPLFLHQAQRSGAERDIAMTVMDKPDKPKKKKKAKRPKTKKGVSFGEVPFLIGSEQEEEHDEASDSNAKIHPKIPTALSLPPPSASQSIPGPKSFEIEEDEDSELRVPQPSSNLSMKVAHASPVPSRMSMLSDSRRNTILSDLISPRSTTNEMSDSSSAFPAMSGEFSAKQVDHYARWFARAHHDKSLPTIQILRDQMKECFETELASRLKLGSRSEPTKLSKTLVGEDLAKGFPSGGVVPPVRKGSFRPNTRR